MIPIIRSAIISILIIICINWVEADSKSSEHQNVYYNAGKIVGVGQCKSGECSFQYKNKDGELKFAISNKPVSIGQLVYQECWYEEARGNMCYVDYQPSKN